MNPYDAILEQLRKAQERGVETVTNRLDFVLESLEGLIAEAKAAVQEAVPSEPDELFPLSECSAAVETARKQGAELEERVSELQDRIRTLEEGGPGTTPATGGPLDLGLLRRLDAARSQSELLREVLPLLLDYVGRAVVLVARDGTVSAWSGIGFPEGERLRSWQGEVSASPALNELMTANTGVVFTPGEDGLFSRWLDGEQPAEEAALIPVTLRGRTVGAIYVDRLEGGPWDLEAARALTAVACWLIDTLAHRTTVPSPALAEEKDLRSAVAMDSSPEPEEPTPEAGYVPVEPVRAPGGEVPEEPELEEEPVEPAAGETAAPPEEAPEEAADEAPGMEEPRESETEEAPAPAGFDPAVTMRVDTAGVIPPVVPPEEEAVPEAEAGAPAGEVEPTPPPAEPVVPPPSVEAVTPPPPVEPVTPPPPVEPVAPPPPVEPITPPPPTEQDEGPATEEQAQHEEARRFARLLVSEIKLYNPEEVDRGRANKDLYQRLKEDIDRSREMFDRRIPESVRSSRDYFREELVRILADGDEDALGM